MYICCTIFLLININKQLVAIVLVLLAYRYVCTYVHIIFIVYTYFPTFALPWRFLTGSRDSLKISIETFVYDTLHELIKRYYICMYINKYICMYVHMYMKIKGEQRQTLDRHPSHRRDMHYIIIISTTLSLGCRSCLNSLLLCSSSVLCTLRNVFCF